MAINDLTQGQHFGDNFILDTGLEKILLNIDGVSIVQDGAGVLSAVAEDAAGTPFDPAGTTLVATDTEAAIKEVLGLVSGVAHTVITGIDLAATGNPNEYTVSISWTDSDGNPQTSTDPTPVIISQPNVVSATAGNLLIDDSGAFFDGPALKAAVISDVLQDCVVTDMWGNTIGTVQELQP